MTVIVYVVLVDNITRPLDSGQLAAVLTADTWGDRRLGTLETTHVPHRSTWAVTGNNVQLHKDMPRRCYLIGLDAKTARPWERTDFEKPDLIQWVRGHRGELVHAVLVLVRHWYSLDCPEPASRRIGSFERWCDTIGGILEAAGLDGFLGNLDELYQEADLETRTWTAFLDAVHIWSQGQAFRTGELVEAMTPDDKGRAKVSPDTLPADCADRVGKPGAVRIGRAFGRRRDVRHGANGLRLVDVGDERRATLWRVNRDPDE